MSFASLIQGNVEEVLPVMEPVTAIFMDPPDNIGLGYGTYQDSLPDNHYLAFLQRVLTLSIEKANIVWVSYHARWTFNVGKIICDLLEYRPLWEAKACIQTFTFGQHNKSDLGNNHRPLIRLKKKSAPLYPDAIRVPSWRLLNGDKRADPRGRVPGDVFEFPRVTGNSRQRRPWHPTQLNEGLIERCLKLSCAPDETVIDLFSGTGTTLRVCRRLELPVIAVEMDRTYCLNIASENELTENPNPFPWEGSWHGY